jgi:transposase
MAEFPFGVTRDIQYGSKVKAHSVYLSQFQLIPYNRIENYFADQMNIALSGGSIFNFNQEAYKLLEKFDRVAKHALIKSPVIHSDETGINVDKKRTWLHSASNRQWVYFYPHAKRGKEAMDEIGILPYFKGILCHDHWKPYYGYDCLHALCNAHHLRELTLAADQDKQQWALAIRALLIEINAAVQNAGGVLSTTLQLEYGQKYDAIITAGEIECSAPLPPDKPKKGRIKKSKSRNLLERLKDYKQDVLRFMAVDLLPFTNNTAENDIRMTKVQQKISGCFRSMEGAYIFCRVRSYILTCQKNGLSATESLDILFQGKLPDFIEHEFQNMPVSDENTSVM